MDRKALRPRKIPKSGVKAAARLQKTRKDEWRWVRGWVYPQTESRRGNCLGIFVFGHRNRWGFYPRRDTFWWKTRLSTLKNLWLRVAEPHFEQGQGATRQPVHSAIANICNELFLHPVLITELCKHPVGEKGGDLRPDSPNSGSCFCGVASPVLVGGRILGSEEDSVTSLPTASAASAELWSRY